MTILDIPNTVRQEPGMGNALGQVQFIFPKKHAAYLHDMPSKYLFVKDIQAFSHWCIHVENPLKLGEVLLSHTNNYSAEDIDKIIKAKKLNQINLKRPIDVLLMYWTGDSLMTLIPSLSEMCITVTKKSRQDIMIWTGKSCLKVMNV